MSLARCLRCHWLWSFAGGLVIMRANPAMAGHSRATFTGAQLEVEFSGSLPASEPGRARILAAVFNQRKKRQDND